jgi:hypothetical protein
MITFLSQLEPAASIDWKFYKPPASVVWLHPETREIESEDQRAPARGPAEVIPTVIITAVTGLPYEWDQLGW